jgi:hypothetical protein
MRHTIILFSVFLLAGCATFIPESMRRAAGYGVTQQLSYYLKVTSEPQGSTIYFNNMAIGTTPAEQLPVSLSVINDADTLYQSFGMDQYTVVGSYYVRVSKEGYEDTFAALDFEQDRGGTGKFPVIKNYALHFVLKKKE